MRSLILLWALILVLGLNSISYAESAGDGPTSAPAVTARQKLDGFVAKADREQADFLTAAREAYLASLKQALDAAMNAASLDAAKWAKAEIERIKAGEPASAEKPKLAAAAAAQSRFLRAGEKAQEDRKRSLEAARKLYITDLEVAKRTALSVAKDLDEAGRIAAEIERAKVMEFGQAVAATPPAGGGTSPVVSATERKPGKINLLKLVDLEHDPVCYGVWKWEKDALVTDGTSFKSIRVPYQPPIEYDLTVEFTAIGSSNEMLFNVAAGDKSFFWSIGAGGNAFCYFGYVNQRWDNSSAVRLPKVIEDGRRMKTTVKVRANSVTGWIDDKQISKVDADWANLRHDGNVVVVGLQVLGLGTSNKTIYHSAEVTEISGPGRIIRRLSTPQAHAQAGAFRAIRVGKSVTLTELHARATQVGSATLMINQNPLKLPVAVNGRDCTRYIFAHAPSSLIYDIPEGAVGFRAIGTRPAGTFPANGPNWRVAICVDDCEVFLSRGIQESGGQIPIEIPLPQGARQIEMRADPLGDYNADHCVWANPEFLFPQ